MKTIKLKLLNIPKLDKHIRVYNNIVRYSFNRFQENLTENETRSKCKEMFKNENSWIVRSAIKTGQGMFSSHGNKKIIFGGKKNLFDYLKGLITKEEFKEKRSLPIFILGEKLHKGNRLFDFDLKNNKIDFKPCKGNKTTLWFVRPHRNMEEELQLLQILIDNKESPVTVTINGKYICLTYDESLIKNKKLAGLKQNRILGIDLNPNYIGVSILEFDKNDEFNVLHKQVFDLTKANPKNKKKFELIEINKAIIKLCNYWKVSTIVVEELNIKHKSLNKGRSLNKMCLNDWCKNLSVNNLKLQCSIHGIKFVEVNPAYSSQIGNIIYGDKNTPDMIAASIEIARRGYKKFSKGWFYPDFNKVTSLLNEQWKQTLKDNFIKDWKELLTLIKNSKLKYRVPLSDCISQHGFSFKHIRSRIFLYIFYIVETL